MSYYGKSLYLDFNTLPNVDRRFSLGRILARGTSATIYHGVDREAGIATSAIFPFVCVPCLPNWCRHKLCPHITESFYRQVIEWWQSKY